MYSKNLETLIQGVIADGIITEKERAVLHKKAEEEGVDIDEIDVYVDGLINQMFPKKVEVIEDDYNVNLFNRIRRNEAIYDIYRTPYCFYEYENANGWNDGDIRIQLVYFKKIGESDKQLYMVLQDTGSKIYVDDLLFETDNGTVLLNENYIHVEDAMKGDPDSFIIDSIELKKLCNSATIQIKLKYHYYRNYKNKEGERESKLIHHTIDRTLPTFSTYLQEFYHDVIDNTAFPTIKTDVKQIEYQLKSSIEEKKKKEKRKDLIKDIIAYAFVTPLGRGLAAILIFFLIWVLQLLFLLFI